MSSIRVTYTLVSEGSSDAALMPIIKRSFDDWADRSAPSETALVGHCYSKSTLSPEKLRDAAEDFPCDLVIIHRDSDTEDHATRVTEIATKAQEAGLAPSRYIPIIPVKKTEAWLLLDEPAIREAVGAPNGKTPLKLPKPKNVERLAKAKETLESVWKTARNTSRRRGHHPDLAAIARNLTNLSQLRQLAAFRAFEDEFHAWLDDFASG